VTADDSRLTYDDLQDWAWELEAMGEVMIHGEDAPGSEHGASSHLHFIVCLDRSCDYGPPEDWPGWLKLDEGEEHHGHFEDEADLRRRRFVQRLRW